MTARRANRAKVLAAMPGSRDEIVATTGLGLTTVWRWVECLVESGEAHVARYKAPDKAGPAIAIYRAGPALKGPVPPKPKTASIQERSAKYRRNAQRSGAWEDTKKRRRDDYWLNKPPRRDPLVAAFFGEA